MSPSELPVIECAENWGSAQSADPVIDDRPNQSAKTAFGLTDWKRSAAPYLRL